MRDEALQNLLRSAPGSIRGPGLPADRGLIDELDLLSRHGPRDAIVWRQLALGAFACARRTVNILVDADDLAHWSSTLGAGLLQREDRPEQPPDIIAGLGGRLLTIDRRSLVLVSLLGNAKPFGAPSERHGLRWIAAACGDERTVVLTESVVRGVVVRRVSVHGAETDSGVRTRESGRPVPWRARHDSGVRDDTGLILLREVVRYVNDTVDLRVGAPPMVRWDEKPPGPATDEAEKDTSDEAIVLRRMPGQRLDPRSVGGPAPGEPPRTRRAHWRRLHRAHWYGRDPFGRKVRGWTWVGGLEPVDEGQRVLVKTPLRLATRTPSKCR